MRMMLVICALVGAVLVPSALAADPVPADFKNAAKYCKALRTSKGVEAFNTQYGTNANKKNAFGKCVAKAARAQTQNELNAAAACRAEQGDATFVAAHGGKTFAQFYGTNRNGKNAYGKCVSAKAKDKKAEMDAEDAEQAEDFKNAAKACAAERRLLGTSKFADEYGTNRNKRNAFGKCVSKHTADDSG